MRPKHFGLVRQIGAAGIDEIDAGQMIFARDLLRAQMLLDRHGIIGAALDRRIIGDDHRLAPLDGANAGDDPGAMDVALVHAIGGERRDFEKGRAGIDEPRHALAREQLAARDMALARTRRAALRRQRAALGKLAEQGLPRLGIGLLFGRKGAGFALQGRHAFLRGQMAAHRPAPRRKEGGDAAQGESRPSRAACRAAWRSRCAACLHRQRG